MRLFKLASIALAFAFIDPSAVGQRYSITDLGPLSPTGINTWGQVSGNLNGHAILWMRGRKIQDLGLLPSGSFSSAAAINDLGVVSGSADGPGTVVSTSPGLPNKECENLNQPFFWTRSMGMHGLGATAFGAVLLYDDWCNLSYFSAEIDIYGRVVGSNTDFATYKWGYLWTGAKGMTAIGYAYQTAANGMNNMGQVVGQSGLWSLEETSHAALWNNDVETDLGTLGGDSSDWSYCSGANDINDLAAIVGWSTLNAAGWCDPSTNAGPFHAFLWRNGVGMQDLGTLAGDTSSVARKITFFGQVIGASGNTVAWQDKKPGGSIDVLGRPFIWSERKGMRDLNSLIRGNSGWVLNTATDINVWGQIVGLGTFKGEAHGYLLTPRVFFGE